MIFRVILFCFVVLALIAPKAIEAQTNLLAGNLTVQKGVWLPGDISPAEITADQDNYSPTGLATAEVLRLSSDASHSITGLVPGASPDGRLLIVYSIDNGVVLKNEDSASTAANRFHLGADVALTGGGAGALLQYDSTAARWRVIGGAAAGGGEPGEGTVTSVGVSVPAGFAVSGSPVTAAGTIAITFATGQTAYRVLATDTSASALALRSLSLAYIADAGTMASASTANYYTKSAVDTMLGDYVPSTRTVNGHALSANVTVTKGDLSLGNVENTALSTWAGSSALTTLGTIATGVWQGTAIGDSYLAATLTGKTYNGLTLTAQTTGFTIAGGTSSKTLTVSNTAAVSGTNTGDQDLSGYALASALDDYVPVTRTVNGSPLSSNVTITTISGNAGTATALATARAINGVDFDGTGPITITAAAGTLTGTTLNSTVVTSSLTALGTIATGVWHGTAIADTYISSAATWNAKQAGDADLTALAALGSTGFAVRTAADTWAQRTIAGTSDKITVTSGDGVSGNPTLTIASTYVGQTSITTLGTVATGTWSATAIAADKGGTGQSSYTVGDLLYASSSSALSKRAAVASGQVLVSAGTGTAPVWSANPTVTGNVAGTSLSATGTIAANGASRITLDYSSGARILGWGVNTSTPGTITLAVANSDASGYAAIGVVSSTGLAVTGDVSSTGSSVYGGGGFALLGSGVSHGIYTLATGSPTIYFDHRGTSNTGSFYWRNGTGGASTLMTLTSSGLAVAGEMQTTTAGTSATTAIRFVNGNGSVGSISTSGSATSYNTSSDVRLKKNVRTLPDSGKIIDALRPVIFDWKNGSTPNTYGFIAQETYKVFPQAVTKGDGGKTITQQWAMDASKFMPVVVSELQSLRSRVAKLESR